jgi:hypothetical protein
VLLPTFHSLQPVGCHQSNVTRASSLCLNPNFLAPCSWLWSNVPFESLLMFQVASSLAAHGYALRQSLSGSFSLGRCALSRTWEYTNPFIAYTFLGRELWYAFLIVELAILNAKFPGRNPKITSGMLAILSKDFEKLSLVVQCTVQLLPKVGSSRTPSLCFVGRACIKNSPSITA